MLLSIISIILNIGYYIVMHLELYTDRVPMPDGGVRVWHRSPLSRLNLESREAFFYVQLFFAVISVITSLLVLFGVKNRIVRMVQLGSFAASTLMFIIIMILTSNSHVRYT